MNAKRLTGARQRLAENEFTPTRSHEDFLIQKYQWAILPNTPAYSDLCGLLLPAETETLERAKERGGGEWGAKAASRIVARAA